MALEQSEIDAAKAAHPNSAKVSLLDGEVQVLVRRPSRPEWKTYRQAALSADASKNAQAAEILFQCCCILPDKSGLKTLLDEHPAVVESCLPVLAKMAGLDTRADVEVF